MATTTSSLIISSNPKFLKHHPKVFTSNQTYPFVNFPKSNQKNLIITSSHSSSSSSIILENEKDPFQIGRFLTNQEHKNVVFLQNYGYNQELESGSLFIRVMRFDELDETVSLLSESFAESMLLPKAYVKFLGFLVKQYLIERRVVMPHAATLLGFFKESGEEELKLCGTVEVCFNQRGANASPPTPTVPKNQPYISNMTVKKSFRRRGIGWHLLNSSEELISQMSSSKEVYLHCRMIDAIPFNMYTRAGYVVYKTDSILTLLTLQRRKHLMRKHLQVSNSF
ncbi:acyltransferase [Lithospermum erythrorhizon]|uniref:Acyltransferase n=1 Tax=Lithospermum erythrorhizon TaxID=34254 RepID=A0AAV3QKN0_LITER